MAKKKTSAQKKSSSKTAHSSSSPRALTRNVSARQNSSKSIGQQTRSLADGVREAFNAPSNKQSAKLLNSPSEFLTQTTARKSVLGRGLSALMSSTVVSVEPKPEYEVIVGPSTESSISPSHSLPEKTTIAHSTQAFDQSSNALRKLEIVEESEHQQSTPEPVEIGPKLCYLAVEDIVRNEDQPRQYFSESELDTLAKSIKDTGLLQPIVVRPKQSLTGRACFEIVAGERRFRAAKRAGLSKIPTLLRELSDRETLELGIIENVQRADLNPIEEAHAYQRLIEDFGQTQSEVAETVGKDRVSIANTLRLLKLANEVQLLLVTKEISAGHGRALLTVENQEEQKRLAKRVLSEGLSVRALEALVAKPGKDEQKSQRPKHPSLDKSPAVLGLEDRFRRALGTKVSLTVDENKQGELRISFFSEAELESLLERLNA